MPIFDQYEVEPTAAYSGSIYSQYMNPYGSIFFSTSSYIKKQISDTSQTEKSEQKNFALANLHVTTDFLLRFISGAIGTTFERYKTLYSSEQIYDSSVPHPINYSSYNVDAFLLVSKSIGPWTDPYARAQLDLPVAESGSSVYMFLGLPDVSLKAANWNQESIVDNKWLFEYPFQSKYKQLYVNKRLIKPTSRTPYPIKTTLSWSGGTNIERMTYTGSADQILFINTYYESESPGNIFSNGGATDYVNIPYALGPNGISDGALIESLGGYQFFSGINILYSTYFGFGTDRGFADPYGSFRTIGPKKFPLSLFNFFGPIMKSGIIVRGWKYGLYSAYPINTGITYRLGRFGQFRDMFEGRPCTATITESGINPYTNEPISKTLFFPIQIAFKSGTIIYEQSRDYITATNPDYNPYDSGIYDIYYRSGQPFFDRENED